MDYKIIHHIPGRIRIGIDKLGHDGLFAQNLQDALSSLDFVNEIVVNERAKSILISYAICPESEKFLRIFKARINSNAKSKSVSLSDWLPEDVKIFINDNFQDHLPLIGLVSLWLGIAGVILPIMPGTPFLLLSYYCYSRSDQRV